MGDTGDVRTHVEIGGRRWRATDPSIPEAFRVELVHELMAARRAVGAGQRAEDDDAVTAARERVQDAKIALGERGPEWWTPTTERGHRTRLRAAILALLRARKPDSTTCPSDAARIAASPGWRAQMDLARDVAAELHDAGVAEIRQGGTRVSDPRNLHGPVRIARGQSEIWPPSTE